MAELIRFFMDVDGKRRIGAPVSPNKKTGWFRIMDGAKSSYVIKRHYKKHNVIYKEVITDEDVHTSFRYEDQTS